AAELYENNIGFSERADVPIEPRLTWQWWLRYPRVEEAKQVVRDGVIRFHPDRWEKVYLHWLDSIQDWCISRQLWWGHRIPVWYCRGLDRESLTEADLRDPQKLHVSLDGPPDPENWEQEDDVLDTWASSWLWPFATMGWPDRAEMEKSGFSHFYPTTTLVTAPDIIFFWVARMIMAGLEFIDESTTSNPKFKEFALRIPFKDVYFTGIIRDSQGRKMSKSLGNSPDPLDLIDRFGADGLRFGIVSIAPQGQDIRFQEDRIEAGRNFCNKLWNASRFRQLSGPMADSSSVDVILARLEPAKFDADDHAILLGLLRLERDIADAFAKFEFSGAVQKLYTYFWSDFCDWYVEVSKSKLLPPSSSDSGAPRDESLKANCLAIQDLVLRQVLLLLHPFTPFITEELWHGLGYGADGTFIQNQSPAAAGAITAKLGALDAAAAAQVDQLKQASMQVRALKAEYNLASKRDVKLSLTATDAQWTILSSSLAGFSRMAGAAEVSRTPEPQAGPSIVTPLGTFTLDLASQVDPAAEKQRLTKELEKVRGHIAGTEARLANPAFAGKAPPAVIDGAKKQLADLKDKAAEIERLIAGL
ncbi:MAG TPA: class I tRNA ligase family protein, partial [Opitutaceae bacterium]